MELKKCCVSGCDATNQTFRLFCFPRSDSLRKLWLDFLVPRNSNLIGLSKEQLKRKFVCERHFDKAQYDQSGKRIRFSYPCLFSAAEIQHGMPLTSEKPNFLSDHNYMKMQIDEDDDGDDDDSSLFIAKADDTSFREHNFCLLTGNMDTEPSTSHVIQQYQGGPSSTLAYKVSDVVQSPCLPLENKPQSTSALPLENKPQSTAAQVIIATTSQAPIVNRLSTNMKKSSSVTRRLSARKRKYIREVKEIATENLGNSGSERLHQAHRYSQDTEFLNNFNLLNKQAKAFLMMQLKLARKNKMARRFSLEDKLLALMILKRGPKVYKLLESMFALPNKRTLHRLSEKISFEPGLNPKIFGYIQKTTQNWTAQKKLCTVVFDEVALTPYLTFDEKIDVIDGFVGENNIKYCDHALVFMIRGICSSWRQSIAYYFCEGTIAALELKKILKNLVTKLTESGLIPLGLVCDQGSTFRTAMQSLREETINKRIAEGAHDDGTIHISGCDLFTFYDPPHLLKGIRNNFINKDILWNNKVATWRDIAFIFDMDNRIGHNRALPNLTEYHIDPTKLKKMKVSVAAQVLSARTAAMLRYTHELDKERGVAGSSTMETTAEVVEFIDKLFDSVNGYPGGASKGKLRKAVKPKSEHHAFWIDAIKKLKVIRFVVQPGQRKHASVPSLMGWIKTLESFVGISKLLFNKYGVEYYYPRFINQDPLENFFGRIRSYNYRYNNPNAYVFKYTFKSLVLSNLMSSELHSQQANCEKDDGETLIGVNYLFEDHDDKENINVNIKVSSSAPASTSAGASQRQTLIDQARLEKIKVQCSAYVAGYICRKISRALNCKACLKTYTTDNRSNIHKYIQFREFKALKHNNLVYPTERFLMLYRDACNIIFNYLHENCNRPGVGKNLKKYITNLSFSCFGCSQEHKKILVRTFVTYVIRLQVHNFVKIINKILKGVISEKYVANMGTPQKLALQKYKKYILRKKSINK